MQSDNPVEHQFPYFITIVNSFLLITISIIVTVRTLKFSIAKMFIHFGFHQRLNVFTKKVFQCILKNFRNFIKQLVNDIFSFCHLYTMYWFHLFCQNKRLSYDFYFIIEEPVINEFTEKISQFQTKFYIRTTFLKYNL